MGALGFVTFPFVGLVAFPFVGLDTPPFGGFVAPPFAGFVAPPFVGLVGGAGVAFFCASWFNLARDASAVDLIASKSASSVCATAVPSEPTSFKKFPTALSKAASPCFEPFKDL